MAVSRCLTVIVTVLLLLGRAGHVQSQGQTYALDRQGTCNQQITVYDQELTLSARSNVAPANPPLECIVYLESAYEMSDGRYRLQMIVEQLLIEDCNVGLTIFNGKGASGNYLRELGCSSKSTDILYTTGRQATVRFSRPQDLYKTAYAITITVKTYEDKNQMPTEVGVDKLATGGIIAIVVGCIAVIALVILLIWCCCTGYIRKFTGLGVSRVWRGKSREDYNTSPNLDNVEKVSTTSSDYQLRNGLDYNDPAVWSSLTGLNKVGGAGNRNFQPGVPRRQATARLANDNYENEVRQQSYANTRPRDSNVYEPYDQEAERSPRFRKRKDTTRRSRRSQGEDEGQGSEGSGSVHGPPKETLIDEPMSISTDDDSIKKPPPDSDDSDVAAAKLHRFESEPDVDTIASPTHINAGVRASIPDLTREDSPPPSPKISPKAKKRSSVSPMSRKKKGGGRGHEPDPMGLPPEAFDPVFTTPTSQEQYPGEFRPLQQQQPMMPFMPYGMFPMVPGQQMYAYAYQAAPQVGAAPGNQSAFFVQSVPTADGSVQNTAFAMHSSRTPNNHGSKGKGGLRMGHPGAPDYSSTPGGSPYAGHKGRGSPTPDLSLITRGAAPPDPGQGHRAMEMKSYADPDTGMQTTQVLWTDNVPDPTDPKPGDSTQVTRKTITRVTTRSGQGDLPAQTTSLLDYQDPNPAFLSPSTPQRSALMNHPATVTPSTPNVDYYLGRSAEPARPPDVFRDAPSRSKAIRDRVTLGDSEA